MRRFVCARCEADAAFEACECGTCGAELGYVPEERSVRKLTADDSGATFTHDESPIRLWRCLNAAWGCNWMLPAQAGDVWCRACRLTRNRPDESDPEAVEGWSRAESAKRRLIHQLLELGLPVQGRSASTPQGLAFDLVYLPGAPKVTGYHAGVITLDLTETDGEHRERLRRDFSEPIRTVLGHLRHEAGHYYWNALVLNPSELDAFRSLFGDERADYDSAINRHHADPGTRDENRFITPYAASHPLEDWAESFCHFLHIDDAVGSASAVGLQVSRAEPSTGDSDRAFASKLDEWRQLSTCVNAISEALGAPALYPINPGELVVQKLAFIHDRVIDAAAASTRLLPAGRPASSTSLRPDAATPDTTAELGDKGLWQAQQGGVRM